MSHPSVVDMLAAAAAARPGGEALVCAGRRFTYLDYWRGVAGLARGLGDRRGQRVATRLGNSIEACVAAFGVLASGAQHVPLNPLYTPAELEPILADAEPSAFITEMRMSVAEDLPCRPDPYTLALLQYTGGTTGGAKGVNLTHRAIASNVAQREALLPTRADAERILCVMPLFHSYAMAMGLFLAVNCRGTLVILERYRPEILLDAIEREHITQIVDLARGERILPAGERGEIRARGPQLMQGYRNRPRETAEALRGGWLYTGDIGELDTTCIRAKWRRRFRHIPPWRKRPWSEARRVLGRSAPRLCRASRIRNIGTAAGALPFPARQVQDAGDARDPRRAAENARGQAG